MTRILDFIAARRRIRLICMTASAVLLVVSLAGVMYASSPAEAQAGSSITYQHSGQFDYVAHVTPGVLYSDDFELADEEQEISPPPEEEDEDAESAPLLFFRELVESFDMFFTYEVQCTAPLQGVTNDASITVTAEHPRLWSKEMGVWPASSDSEDLVMTFPLDFDALESSVERIEEEIDISREQSDFVIDAHVRTTGRTLDGQAFEEQYTHTLRVILEENTLELQGELQNIEERAIGDELLTMDGRFDYEAYLYYSELYDSMVLRSQSLPTAEPDDEYEPVIPEALADIGPGQVLYPETVESIDAVFTYDLMCEQPLRDCSQSIEIAATLSSGDNWSKRLVLVPLAPAESSRVRFPIDIHYFHRVVEAIGEQTGIRIGSYDIAIEATVHSEAEVDKGRIDEVYTQTLTGSRDGALVTFDDSVSGTQPGIVGSEVMAESSGRDAWRPPSLAGVVVGIGGLAVVGATRLRGRRDELAANVAKARKKYRDILVEVEGAPAAGAEERTVTLPSLDDLARVAEQAMKPMLYYGGAQEQVFFVLDGDLRYVHTLR